MYSNLFLDTAIRYERLAISGQPEHTSNLYSFSLSALHIQRLLTYKQTFTYCGIGPMVSYSWNRSTDNVTIFYSPSYFPSNLDVNENTD